MSPKNKQPRVKLIANPGAGDPLKTSKNLEMACRYFQENGIKVDVALAQPKKEIAPLVKKAVKDGYRTLIGMGGDGTIEALVRGLMDTQAGRGRKIRLGILPSGTANNIAKSIGIPEDMPSACRLIASGSVRKLDMGRVRVNQKKPFYFIELTAIGLVAALYPEAAMIQKGKLASIKDAVNTFLQHETHPEVILTMDGESKIKTETLLVTISNTPAYGLNFLVAPQASLQDGLLDISIYPAFSKADLIAYYARVMNEGEVVDEHIQRFRVHKLKVKASPRLEVMADGVMQGRGTVRIKTCPGALRVIAPEESAGLALPLDVVNGDQAIPVPLAVEVEMAQ